MCTAVPKGTHSAGGPAQCRRTPAIMSSRPHNSHADRRSNGNSENMNGPSRARATSTQNNSFKDDYPPDSRGTRASQRGSFSAAGTAHKRSASGNPRPGSRSNDERRAERVTVTARDKLSSRSRGRDAAPHEKWKAKDGAKSRPPETRQREAPPESPSSELRASLPLFDQSNRILRWQKYGSPSHP